MVKSIKNKRAAMEMTVGTIVTIVLLMSALVLGLILTKTIFANTTENVAVINDQVKGEINNLFGDEGTGFVIKLGNQNTAKVKQGTLNFGIPIGFVPTNPGAWGPSKTNCVYNIIPVTTSECVTKGYWNIASIKDSIKTGYTDVKFDEFENNNGYSLIKIDVPETVSPCLQRFSVEVKCLGTQYASEFIKKSFDLEVIKKGLF
jgi:hypothetical protein